jgi:hypothetical protein
VEERLCVALIRRNITMNQDKRQQGTEFDKHQDQSGQPRQGERSTTEQQKGQQPGGPQQGQRERGEPGSKSGGQGGQRR